MAKAVPVPKSKFNPDEGIERLYLRGVLPFGGGISLDGKVVFARSREDVERRIRKYRALKK